MDRLDFDVSDDPSLPGQVLFHILSEDAVNRCSIESFGSVCIVSGRLKLQPPDKSSPFVTIPFEYALDSSEQINVKEYQTDEIPEGRCPPYITPRRLVTIKSGIFNAYVPLESIYLDIVVGSYSDVDDIDELPRTKSVILFQSQVKFKNYDNIKMTEEYHKYTIEEILFDKMILFTTAITLPRINPIMTMSGLASGSGKSGGGLRINVHTPSTPTGNGSPRNGRRYTNNNNNRMNIWMKLKRLILKLKVFIEIAVYILLMLGWGIYRERHMTSATYDLYTIYSVLYALAALAFMIYFRSFMHYCLRRWMTSIEFNGRSFFVNGWQAWSFCGSILHGQKPPIYSMPSLFVKAFHHGGVGTALPILLGQGEVPFRLGIPPPYGSSASSASPSTSPYEYNSNHHNNNHNNNHRTSTTLPTTTTLSTSSSIGLAPSLMVPNSSSAFTITKATEEDNKKDYHPHHHSNNNNNNNPFSNFFGGGGTGRGDGNNNHNHHHNNMLNNNNNTFTKSNTSNKQTKNTLLLDNLDIHMNKDYIASDMFTLLSDLRTRFGIVLGYLSQHNHFGCISTNVHYDRLTVHLSGDGVLIPSQGKFTTDPLLLYTVNDLDAPFTLYMNLSSQINQVDKMLYSKEKDKERERVLPPVGWCSWYHFYEKINEKILLNNMHSMKKHQVQTFSKSMRFNLFQIDDGYQVSWGDWTVMKAGYSTCKSLTNTVDELHECGYRSGIWLAPFGCDQGSALAKKYPDWLVRKYKDPVKDMNKHYTSFTQQQKQTKPCNSANCGKFFYGLDITHPAFQEHIKGVLRTVTKVWGFRYLKFDFLYASILQDGQDHFYDRSLTRAQILQQGMRLIKETVLEDDTNADEKEQQKKKHEMFILGCGAPLGSVIGHVHANRISADMGLTWDPGFPLPSRDGWNLPCARNAVRNTITRAFMHNKWWINDPDCLLVRDILAFTEAEMMGIVTVKAISGGSMIISDDFDAISRKRLKMIIKILPPTNQAPVVVDLAFRDTPELMRVTLLSNRSKLLKKQQAAAAEQQEAAEKEKEAEEQAAIAARQREVYEEEVEQRRLQAQQQLRDDDESVLIMTPPSATNNSGFGHLLPPLASSGSNDSRGANNSSSKKNKKFSNSNTNSMKGSSGKSHGIMPTASQRLLLGFRKLDGSSINILSGGTGTATTGGGGEDHDDINIDEAMTTSQDEPRVWDTTIIEPELTLGNDPADNDDIFSSFSSRNTSDKKNKKKEKKIRSKNNNNILEKEKSMKLDRKSSNSSSRRTRGIAELAAEDGEKFTPPTTRDAAERLEKEDGEAEDDEEEEDVAIVIRDEEDELLLATSDLDDSEEEEDDEEIIDEADVVRALVQLDSMEEMMKPTNIGSAGGGSGKSKRGGEGILLSSRQEERDEVEVEEEEEEEQEAGNSLHDMQQTTTTSYRTPTGQRKRVIGGGGGSSGSSSISQRYQRPSSIGSLASFSLGSNSHYYPISTTSASNAAAASTTALASATANNLSLPIHLRNHKSTYKALLEYQQRLLIKEKFLDKKDLLKRWYLFTVGHWQDHPAAASSMVGKVIGSVFSSLGLAGSSGSGSSGSGCIVGDYSSCMAGGSGGSRAAGSAIDDSTGKKTHFVHVRDIFGSVEVEEMLEYTRFLYRKELKKKREQRKKYMIPAAATAASLDLTMMNNGGGGGYGGLGGGYGGGMGGGSRVSSNRSADGGAGTGGGDGGGYGEGDRGGLGGGQQGGRGLMINTNNLYNNNQNHNQYNNNHHHFSPTYHNQHQQQQQYQMSAAGMTPIYHPPPTLSAPPTTSTPYQRALQGQQQQLSQQHQLPPALTNPLISAAVYEDMSSIMTPMKPTSDNSSSSINAGLYTPGGYASGGTVGGGGGGAGGGGGGGYESGSNTSVDSSPERMLYHLRGGGAAGGSAVGGNHLSPYPSSSPRLQQQQQPYSTHLQQHFHYQPQHQSQYQKQQQQQQQISKVLSRSNSSTSSSILALGLGIPHIIHLFNFWLEKYSHKVIYLDEEESGEVAFVDIPSHSAHIYNVNISLHPLMPKYLGSNIHFTCGQEISAAYFLETPIEVKRALQAFCHNMMMTKKRSRTQNIAVSRGSTPPAAAAAAVAAAASSASKGVLSSLMNIGPFSSNCLSPKHPANQQPTSTTMPSPTSAAATAASQQILHAYQPKVYTIRIDFEPGYLKDATWEQFIWIFLPISIQSSRLLYITQILGKMEVNGTAVMHDGAATKVEMVKYIEETLCNTAGFVYKIPVSCSSSGSSGGSKNDKAGEEEEKEYVTISWICDVIQEVPSNTSTTAASTSMRR